MYEETCTVLQETAQKVNCRPIYGGQWVEREPLRPADFLMGRASTGAPSAKFETGKNWWKYSKIYRRRRRSFGNRWMKEIFPLLLLQEECAGKGHGSEDKWTCSMETLDV
jgi:hypothetical protein